MKPDFKEQLKDWKRQHRKETNHGKKKKQRKQTRQGKSEHFTERDMKYLMNENMPTYRRYRGSFRQR